MPLTELNDEITQSRKLRALKRPSSQGFCGRQARQLSYLRDRRQRSHFFTKRLASLSALEKKTATAESDSLDSNPASSA